MASTSILSHVTEGKSLETLRAISSHSTSPLRIELDLVTTVRSLRGREAAMVKAKRIRRSMPTAVKIATSVATSHGVPRWERPPWPAYLVEIVSLCCLYE